MRDEIGIERPLGSDRAEHLACPADLLGFDILEHEDVKVVAGLSSLPGKSGRVRFELGFQRRLFSRQIGEAAARQLGEVVESAKVALAGGADAKAHAACRCRRRMASADKRRALGQAVDDQIFVHAVDLAAANPHRVDDGHSARGDVVAVAHAARWLPRDRLAKVGAGLPDELEQRFGRARERLGRPAEAAVQLDLDLALGNDGGDGLIDLALGRGLDIGRSRPQVHAQDCEIRHDIAGAAAFDPRRVDRQAVALEPVESKREIGRREQRVAPILRIASGVRRAAAHDDPEIAAAWPSAGERSVGQRRGLVGQRRALALRRMREQGRRAERTDFLVAVDHDLVAEPIGAGLRSTALSAASMTASPPFMSATPGPFSTPSSSQRVSWNA